MRPSRCQTPVRIVHTDRVRQALRSWSRCLAPWSAVVETMRTPQVVPSVSDATQPAGPSIGGSGTTGQIQMQIVDPRNPPDPRENRRDNAAHPRQRMTGFPDRSSATAQVFTVDNGEGMPDGSITPCAPSRWVPQLRCRACREAGALGGCASCLAWTEYARTFGVERALEAMDTEEWAEVPVLYVFESDVSEAPPEGWEAAVDASPRLCLGCGEETRECCCEHEEER